MFSPKSPYRLVTVAMIVISGALLAQENDVTDQDLVSQWLQTERLISKESLDWREEKAHISQLLDLYEKELTLLNEELSKAGKNASLVDEEAEALKENLKQSEDARRKAIASLSAIKPRVQKLLARFPEPLQMQLLDEEFILSEKVTNANSGEIFRAIIKILQEASRFHRSFTFEEQEILLNDETYRAKVMYLGLNRGFFLAGEKAGTTSSSADGWTFTERNELAGELRKAFAIQTKETPSAFFELPLKK